MRLGPDIFSSLIPTIIFGLFLIGAIEVQNIPIIISCAVIILLSFIFLFKKVLVRNDKVIISRGAIFSIKTRVITFNEINKICLIFPIESAGRINLKIITERKTTKITIGEANLKVKNKLRAFISLMKHENVIIEFENIKDADKKDIVK